MAGEAKKAFEALKQMSKAELLEREKLLRKELFNLRFQRVTGHVENPARFRVVRREIARVLTLMRTATEKGN